MSVVRRAATALTALAALAAGAQPVTAATVDGPTRLVLTVTPAGPPAQRGAMAHAAVLTCEPAGGRHPYARQACAALIAADGGFEHLAPTRTMCPMLYAPVTAAAGGVWRGRRVSWSHQYANSCVLGEHTGAVFRF